MVFNTITLHMTTPNVFDNVLEVSIKGFILNHAGKSLIITIHHFLPVERVFQENINFDIIINSAWSDVLILDSEQIDYSQYQIHTLVQIKLPKNGDLLTMKVTDELSYDLRVRNHTFLPFNDIMTADNKTVLPYITALFDSAIENPQGLSGTPVFIGDKIAGIFSKYNPEKNLAYIIPIYVVMKNLRKKNNNKICGVPFDKYNVKNNEIYHPALKINIPLSTYFLMECDDDIEIYIQHKKEGKLMNVNYPFDSVLEMFVTNERELLSRNNNEYKINSRLVAMLLKCYSIDIVICLVKATIKHNSKLWVKLENSELIFSN